MIQILIFLFIYLTSIQCDSTDTTGLTQSSAYTSSMLSTAYSSPMATDASHSPTVQTAVLTSMNSNGISSVSLPPSTETSTSAHGSSMMTNGPASHSTFSSMQTSGLPTMTQPTNRVYNLILSYIVESSSPLRTGNITTATVLASVEAMVNSSINLTSFTITVRRVEIRASAKSSRNEMLTDTVFVNNNSSNNCDISCFNGSLVRPTQNFSLPAPDDNLTSVYVLSAPTLVLNTTTTTTVNPITKYQKGEPPPGVAAQIGMGVGITLIGIIIIVEIFILWRKYGLSHAFRQPQYEMPS